MLARSRSLFDGEILGPAVVASFRKLDPRVRLRNPVMFVCEAGALVTLIYTAHDALAGNSKLGFDIAISIWLWFTVVFANLAEAVAEGRGKAQAEFLRRTKTETIANRLVDGTVQAVSATRLRKGDRVRVVAGELIPADGEIVEGAATVDESAITGESAPVIRETGGDRSSSFLDRMISLVEGAQRQKTPNEIALSILLAGLTIVFLIASPRWRRSRSTPAPNRASSS
jgi:potassium-transporting ATPase ATP-binding subunit